MNEIYLLGLHLLPLLIAALAIHGGLHWLERVAGTTERRQSRFVFAGALAIGGGFWLARLAWLLAASPQRLGQLPLLPALCSLGVLLAGVTIVLRILLKHRLRLVGWAALVLALTGVLALADWLVGVGVDAQAPWGWPWAIKFALLSVAAIVTMWSCNFCLAGSALPWRRMTLTLVFALAVAGMGFVPLLPGAADEGAAIDGGGLMTLALLSLPLAAYIVLSPPLAELLKIDLAGEVPATGSPRHGWIAFVLLLGAMALVGVWTVAQHRKALQISAPQHGVLIGEIEHLQALRQDLADVNSVSAWQGAAGEKLRQSWLAWQRNGGAGAAVAVRNAELVVLPLRLDEAAAGRSSPVTFQAARDRLFQSIDVRQQGLVQQLKQVRQAIGRTGAAAQATGVALLLTTALLIVGAFCLVAHLARGTRRAWLEQARLHADLIERDTVSDVLQHSNESLEGRLDALRRHLQDVSLQRELGRMLDCCQTFDEARDIIRSSMARLFPESAGQLFIDNPATAQMEEACRWGELPRTQTVMTPDDCWGVRLGQPHWVQTPQNGPRCKHVPIAPARQSLCIPMTAQGRNQGMLTLLGSLSHSDCQFSDVEHQLALSVAEQISIAIANLHLRETLKLQSISDPLTGLFNRRYLEECLRRELARAKRSHGTLGVAMIDIDHFKRYNDTYGHEAGDAVLRALAQCLLNLGRADDVVCRFGGEEFTVLLPGIDHEGLTDWGERLMSAVRLLAVDFHGQRLIGITISIGAVLSISADAETDPPLERADAALYAAKREGRNRLRWWTAADPTRAEAESTPSAAQLQPAD
ncbi:hypothetical protein JHS3_10130 [Jeongeupia sp. HS-3]|uniref:GGDEF domain-containing protein n=1 Tax=Jeongeupia sp. HS-3 TaxID=1009682 RepID=UPI0018A5EBF7|nr:sensor domain-containing diguanylate cyclase [Jeongeupia sp. HS-3]BCL75277.1 hypothetical protein JHS3_10130 [Jeongeupia sp. HS-3]